MSTHRTRMRAVLGHRRHRHRRPAAQPAAPAAGQRRRQHRVAPPRAPASPTTRITLGITTPLCGATAGPGTCTVAGITAYFGAKNADGGVKFGDGKTRKVEIKALDDAYDPQKAAANYDQLKDSVFAMTAGLGTPTNRAWREAAIADKVPQALVDDRRPDLLRHDSRAPGASASCRSTRTRARPSASCWRRRPTTHKVAILSQNDDYGKGYVEGFKTAIKGTTTSRSSRSSPTRRPTPRSTRRSPSSPARGADVFFNAMSITPLVISSLQKAQELKLAAELVPAVEHLEPRRDPRAGRRRGVPGRLLGVVREGGRKPGLRRRRGRREIPRRPQAVRELPGHPGVPALRSGAT